jgi:hypothetical protein
MLPHLDELDHIEIEKRALQRSWNQVQLLIESALMPKRDELPGWWSIMQDHGAPTRLLNRTQSPFVTVYFALVAQPHQDGAVWRFNVGALTAVMDERYWAKDRRRPQPRGKQKKSDWRPSQV